MLAADQRALFQLPGLDARNEQPDDAVAAWHDSDPQLDDAVAAHRDSLARVAAAYRPVPNDDALYHEPATIANAVHAPSSDLGAAYSAEAATVVSASAPSPDQGAADPDAIAGAGDACEPSSDRSAAHPQAVAASSRRIADTERESLIAATDRPSEKSDASITLGAPAESSTSVPTPRRPVRRVQKGALPSPGAAVSRQERGQGVRPGAAASRREEGRPGSAVSAEVVSPLPPDDAPPSPGTRRII